MLFAKVVSLLKDSNQKNAKCFHFGTKIAATFSVKTPDVLSLLQVHKIRLHGLQTIALHGERMCCARLPHVLPFFFPTASDSPGCDSLSRQRLRGVR